MKEFAIPFDASYFEEYPQFDRLRYGFLPLKRAVRTFLAESEVPPIGDTPLDFIVSLGTSYFFHESPAPVTGSALLETALSSWEENQYSFPISGKSLSNLCDEVFSTFRPRIIEAMRRRLDRHILSQDEAKAVISASVRTQDLPLLTQLARAHPEEISRALWGFDFEKSPPEFQRGVAELIRSQERSTISNQTVFKAHVLTGHPEDASDLLNEMIEDNPHDATLPEMAAQIGRATTGLMLLLVCHRDDVSSFHEGWREVGRASALADSVEMGKIQRLLLASGSGKTSSSVTDLSSFISETDPKGSPLALQIIQKAKTGTSALMVPEKFDSDQAALFYFAGAAEIPSSRETALGVLRGMIERFSIKKRGDLLFSLTQELEKIGDLSNALSAFEALGNVDRKRAVESADRFLNQCAKTLPIRDVLDIFEKLTIMRGRPPIIRSTVENLIDDGRLRDAMWLLQEADRMAIDYRKKGWMDPDWDRAMGLQHFTLRESVRKLIETGNRDELRAILTHFTRENTGEPDLAFKVAFALEEYETAVTILEQAQGKYPNDGFMHEFISLFPFSQYRQRLKNLIETDLGAYERSLRRDSLPLLSLVDRARYFLPKLSLLGYPIHEKEWLDKFLQKEDVFTYPHVTYRAMFAAFSQDDAFVAETIGKLKKSGSIFGLTCVALGQNDSTLLKEVFASINTRSKEALVAIISAYQWVEQQLIEALINPSDIMSKS